MRDLLLRLQFKLHETDIREEGQDLVEYALLVSLIGLPAIAGVSHVSPAVNKVFTNVSTSLA